MMRCNARARPAFYFGRRLIVAFHDGGSRPLVAFREDGPRPS